MGDAMKDASVDQAWRPEVMTEERCRTCRFGRMVDDKLQCRRRAAIQSEISWGISWGIWPNVHPSQWCGEWEGKPEHLAAIAEQKRQRDADFRAEIEAAMSGKLKAVNRAEVEAMMDLLRED